MKQVKEKHGLKIRRIGSKHAFYYACRDENNVVHVIMYSYDTPIFIVSTMSTYPDSKLHVVLNKDAYNYSRTTSKQISQWLSELHMFTSWGCWLPWSFRNVLEFKDIDELTFDYVDYYIVSENTLSNLCYGFGYAGFDSLELWQVR